MRILSKAAIIGVVLLSCLTAWSAPKRSNPATSASPKTLYSSSYLTTNRLLGFTTNFGNIFYDVDKLFGQNNGLYFPYSSIANITSRIDTSTIVYGAGIWMGGRIGGQPRVTVAEYNSEYGPGPMMNGTFLPDNPGFRVYKLYRDSLEGNPNTDYLEWPVAQGAPVDGNGKPLMRGDQMTWCVYNDANPQRHTNNTSATLPLGIEVQQTAWSFAGSDPNQEHSIYVLYKFYNKGTNPIDSFHVAFWVDPDIGDFKDLVGCDSASSLFFAYKGNEVDGVYGVHPPACGGKIVTGLIVPSIGSTGYFDGNPVSNARNLPMTAFTKYINGTDPDSPQEAYYYMQGLNSDGTTYSYGGSQTRYQNSGDPVNGSGDLDVGAADRRMMASCGPIGFLPGDSQQLEIKFAVGQGSDRLASVNLLRLFLNGTYVPSPCSDALVSVSDQGKLTDVRFVPAEQQWLRGVNFGASYFNNGVGSGTELFGSALSPELYPDSFPTIELRFSRLMAQRAYRYLRPTYDYDGYGVVPFTVWDIDHNRQLNVAFVETANSGTDDGVWNLSDSAHYGGREYLFIFNSSYSGENPSVAYKQKNLRTDAQSLDILYGGWFCLSPGHTMADLADGQKLVLEAQSVGRNGAADALSFHDTRSGEVSKRVVHVVCSSGTGMPSFSFEASDSTAFSVVENPPRDSAAIATGVVAIREVASPSGPVEPPDGKDVWLKPNSTGDWMVTSNIPSLDRLNYLSGTLTHDWEIRFTSTGSEAFALGTGKKVSFRVPFEIWNVGDGSIDYPADDQRLLVVVYDIDGSGAFNWGDMAYTTEIPYVEGSGNHNGFIRDSISLGRIAFADISNRLSMPAVGTVLRVVSTKYQMDRAIYSPDGASEFYGAEGRGPTDITFESSRNLRLSFAPPAIGTFAANLVIRDSLNGEIVKTIRLTGSTPASCCVGDRGDFDGNLLVDLSDLSLLVEFLTDGSIAHGFVCPDEVNVDGRRIVDLADLSLLVAYLTGEDAHPAACP